MTLARPTGVVAGDVLVAVVMHHDATSDPVLPAGWTVTWRNGTDASAVVAMRVATTSEPSSYAFSGLDPDDATAAVLLAWSGADATAPVLSSEGSSGSGTTATAPSLSLATAPARLVTVFLVDDTAAAEQLTVAAGPAVRASVHGTGVQPVRAVVADRAVTATGGTGATTATLSASRGWHAVSLALRSDGRPTPVQLGWTAPTDPFTTGYAVTRPTGDVVTVAGRTTTTWSDTAAPTAGGLWTVRATSGTWRSTAVTASVPAC
ncbi:hypothetical protein [Cellulomonas marina]|uniref:Uncharacterized protein n=1 Tax=Cellulomonas marina TaxID=988821 RepID=A0A1I0YT36_9CELL|nr:hypothetical protein [Cellulomonas marina]GIG27515.1 hypothetical protein Cma02nite_01150 [Cellulomonas marina]SFB16559.1 hypothetical protein SAMN05421867_108161 [Cellulomonas marina]